MCLHILKVNDIRCIKIMFCCMYRKGGSERGREGVMERGREGGRE